MGLDDIVDTGDKDETTPDDVDEAQTDDERLKRMYKLVVEYDKRMENIERRIKVLETLMADYVIEETDIDLEKSSNGSNGKTNVTADNWLDHK